MLWMVLIAVLMWILQCVLGVWQFNKFNKEFRRLRKEGRVAIGKAKGRLVAGSVVMLCIDRDDKITKGLKMQGLTIFAGLKPIEGLNGARLTDLDETSCQSFDKQTRKALLNAVDNFREFQKKEANKQHENAVGQCMT